MGGRNLRTRCTPAPFAFSEAVVQSVPVSHARKPSAFWVLPRCRLSGNATTCVRRACRSRAPPKDRCCLAPGRRASRQPSRCGRSMRSRQKQQPAERRRSRAATFGYQRTHASGLNALATEGPAPIFKRRLAIPVTLLQRGGGRRDTSLRHCKKGRTLTASRCRDSVRQDGAPPGRAGYCFTDGEASYLPPQSAAVQP